MLVKFFKHGNIKNATGGRSGGGGAVRDYLLKDKKDKSQPRTGATVFRGDPELTTEIINGIKNTSIYTSGVLSFSADEQPSEQQLNEIIDSFENTLFPNLDDDQYSSYWVMHQDKGRTELHFVFANIELITQKSLPVYYHKKDLDLIDNWKDITNYEYGLIDPNSPDRKRDLVLSQINFDDQTDDQLKDEIHDEIFNEVTQNKNIKSRADIVNLFKSKGYEVTRQGKKENSISIKHPHQKDNPDKKLRNLKFKGELYSPTFNRDQLNKDVKFYNSKRDQRIQNKRQSFEIELENRRKRLETKFSKIDRTPLDNELTSDLKAINSNLADMADWQRQTLKQIIAESLESVSSEQSNELQQILFDSIDSQIKGEPLPEFDQIIQNYQNQLELAQQQVEQQRLEQQQFEQALTEQKSILNTDYGILPEEFYSQFESMTNEQLYDDKEYYEAKLQMLFNKAQHKLLSKEEINEYQAKQLIINSIDNIIAEREQLEQATQTAEPNPAPTMGERSDDEVAQPTPDLDHHPEPTAEQQQQAELVKAERLNQLAKIDTASLDPSDLVEMRADLDKYTYSDIKNGQQECEQFIADMQVKAQTEDLTLDELSDYQQAITTVKGIIALHDELEIKRQFEQAIIAQSDPNTKKYYMGYVVKVNEKGAYQQTKDGIVLHTKYANSTSLDTRTHYCFEYDKGKGINNVIAYPYIDTSRFNKPKDLDQEQVKNSGMDK